MNIQYNDCISLSDNHKYDEFWVGAEYNPNTEDYLWDGTDVVVEGWKTNQPIF